MHILIIFFFPWAIFKCPSSDSVHTGAVPGAVRLFFFFFLSNIWKYFEIPRHR